MIQLMRDIASAEWAIEPHFAEQILNQLMAEQYTFEPLADESRDTVRLGAHLAKVRAKSFYQCESTAIISIKDVISYEDDWCGKPGSQTMCGYIAEAVEDASVETILLLLDTPGGMVKGTQTLAEAVAEARKTKPVKALVTGMAASAGYFIASAASEIMVAEPSSQLGSIGVMVTLADYTKMQAENGIKVHRIYAEQSPDKGKSYEDALKGRYKALQEETLNPMAQNFIDFVRRMRPQVSEEALTGRLFVANAAMQMGLADGYATLDSILKSTNKSSSNFKSTTMTWKSITSVFGWEPKADQNGATIPNSELDRMDAKAAELLQLQNNIAQAQERIAAQDAEIAALQEQLAQANAAAASAKNELENVRREVATQIVGREAATESAPVVTAADVMEQEPKHEYAGSDWAKNMMQ
ncbi:S49 family peptidase [Rhodoflexus caldus]|uniref:S49 family peptidase n=1 Tax=Rhodoflexus caldus TaxID=2891236 RepID=UPI00202A4E3C|nr:S49 family peptidase [Rhodoflexus caldus]